MFVVSRGGTFGTVHRTYRGSGNVEMLVIKWGRFGWLTPVRRDECRFLKSSYESVARDEAERWYRAGCPTQWEPTG